MEMRELRLGNWVRDPDGNPLLIDEPFRIGEAHFFNPIPITPDIIDKNNLYQYLTLQMGEYYYWWRERISSNPIRYVHTLQNVHFALNEEELDINQINL